MQRSIQIKVGFNDTLSTNEKLFYTIENDNTERGFYLIHFHDLILHNIINVQSNDNLWAVITFD